MELKNDELICHFPEVHPKARLRITFQRTLRIPDDDSVYPLPPGLGRFPLRHVDDFPKRAPPTWLAHGGVMLPIYQAEAMWLSFDPEYLDRHEAAWPFAIKIATGKIDAVSGNSWQAGLHRDPQDYLVAPEQPWLDGWCVAEGEIRQFVAMPQGRGYTAEEQLTGKAEHGGLQIQVVPMGREAFERRFPVQPRRSRGSMVLACPSAPELEMGLAPGGRMRQAIERDPYDLADWHATASSRCFVHLANSERWRSITGKKPPTKPLSARDYTEAGLPWFDWYDERSQPLPEAGILGTLQSVATLGRIRREKPLPENASVMAQPVVSLRAGLAPGQVREGGF